MTEEIVNTAEKIIILAVCISKIQTNTMSIHEISTNRNISLNTFLLISSCIHYTVLASKFSIVKYHIHLTSGSSTENGQSNTVYTLLRIIPEESIEIEISQEGQHFFGFEV